MPDVLGAWVQLNRRTSYSLTGIHSSAFLLQGFHALGFSDFALSMPTSSILAVMVSLYKCRIAESLLPCIHVGPGDPLPGKGLRFCSDLMGPVYPSIPPYTCPIGPNPLQENGVEL